MNDIENQMLRSVMTDLVTYLEQTFPFAQALFTQQEGTFVTVTDRETRIRSFSPGRGVVLSIYNGRYMVELGSSDTSESHLWDNARRLVKQVAVKPPEAVYAPGEPWSEDFISPFEEDPRKLSLAAKIDHVMQIREQLKTMSPRIVASSVRYGEITTRKIYVNRTKNLFQELLHTQCVPSIIVSDGRISKHHHNGNGRQAGFEAARIDPQSLNTLVHEAELLLSAGHVEPGIYDVVGGPELAGVIAHEAFGHGVESDMFLKKRAKAVEYLDQTVASEKVDLYDSPAYPGLSGSYFFDDEGMKSSETCIIEKGILRRTLTDHRSATLLQYPRTANGRRQSYGHKVYARMSNTYFGPGTDSLDNMIASIDQGLYMPHGSNGMEDPKNWGIQVESPFAIEIKNGRLTNTCYSPVVITGFVPDLLKSISMTGATLDFMGLGICQKGHKEQVPVAIGGPHLKMRALVG